MSSGRAAEYHLQCHQQRRWARARSVLRRRCGPAGRDHSGTSCENLQQQYPLNSQTLNFLAKQWRDGIHVRTCQNILWTQSMYDSRSATAVILTVALYTQLFSSKVNSKKYEKVIVRPLSTVGYTSVAASAIHRRRGLTNLIHGRCSVK